MKINNKEPFCPFRACSKTYLIDFSFSPQQPLVVLWIIFLIDFILNEKKIILRNRIQILLQERFWRSLSKFSNHWAKMSLFHNILVTTDLSIGFCSGSFLLLPNFKLSDSSIFFAACFRFLPKFLTGSGDFGCSLLKAL